MSKADIKLAQDDLKRLYVERQLVLYLNSVLDDEWAEETYKQLLTKQVARIAQLGLDKAAVLKVFDTLESWQNRFYGLYFTYTDHTVGPDFKLTFVDEMDTDPDVIAMRELMKKTHEN